LTKGDNVKNQLLEIASQYSSPEDFKAKNLPKYLLAKKQRLLRVAFPPTTTSEAFKGIYKLYKGKTVVFIGYSLDNLLEAMQMASKTIPCNNYVYYKMSNHSDIITLYTYMVNKFKPRHNKDVQQHTISFSIVLSNKLLGEPFTGKL